MSNKSLTDIVNALPDYDPNALSVDQAKAIIDAFITPIQEAETVAIRPALGRVLATDIISPINVPPHDNSAMDGYAFRSDDLIVNQSITLKVIGIAYAGKAYVGAVQAGECVRIMTGAAMPADCDTVIPQELAQNATDSFITIPADVVKAGDNRRLAGEDLAAGKAALRKGKKLSPADIGLIASLGISRVFVKRRLRVAFFSTGDELRSAGETLDEGCIYDSNSYTIYGMLTRLGCDVIDMGVVRDDPDSLEAAMRSACEDSDVIITSGGVSVGDADYTKQLLEKLGDVAFWKINMRPGRPMAFGKISSNGKSTYLFGLPGNPVAVMVSFYFFAREALLQMMGTQREPLPLMRVVSQSTIRKKPGRTEYQRGILSRDENGNQSVRITGAQGSGILRSMSEANCMVVLRHDRGSVNAGELVDVAMFDGLI
ncbi:MAG TPA: gephyrin-like molybdotransferase Glp [Burkholderiaceae bacterium]|jgi:molybdopterin molybdotransferase